MSTTIESWYGTALMVSAVNANIRAGGPYLTLGMSDERGSVTGKNFAISDLLAALRTEGILPAEPEPLAEREASDSEQGRLVPADAIVILRETLPGITPIGPDLVEYADIGKSTYVGEGAPDVGGLRAQAGRLLALAEYLDAHPPKPPVDEEMVLALADLLRDRDYQPGDPREARRLYLAGVRIGEATK